MKGFKGRLSFKQYIPNKPKKWGIKIWSLCDSRNGFNLRWRVYTGKLEDDRGDETLGSHVVRNLLDGMDGSGHKVFMDNFFSYPELFHSLKQKNMGACGTVRSNRKGLPKNIGPKDVKLKQGDLPVFWHGANYSLTFTTWQDTKHLKQAQVNKEIRLKKDATGKRTVKKPALVQDYNKYMGGVDRFDQLSAYYCYPHKSQKWYQIMYHYVIETALVNGHIAYKESHPDVNIDQTMFREKVIDSLIPLNIRTHAKDKGNTVDKRRKRCLVGHFCAEYVNKSYRPECIVCSDRQAHQRHQTRNYCEDCDQAMCFPACFKRYHTQYKYKVTYN
ncbi:PREDICTED: piggyBac transposable element-derived protein 4-like [Priapulus caudatus]|uniref:PiggyBac transposable element-derived protein 4-like n=1 Tax=Priapulus caudatus TaxID=37621 RepID=A0ABM1EYJ6_PRICU|nr:PREDICTED: piggyBac transposable element-derived protein 4-like [Priapulus caudatus]